MPRKASAPSKATDVLIPPNPCGGCIVADTTMSTFKQPSLALQ